MVLVAPRPLLQPAPAGDAAAAAAAAAPADRGTGAEVLALLRGDTAARPRFDPGLAGGLRAWLEDAAYEAVVARGEHAPPLFLGPRQLFGSPAGRGGDALSDDVALSRLVHALFRQLVHTGQIDDPLCDALEALRASEGTAVVRHVASLRSSARSALAEAVASHAGNLRSQVPRFSPGWMPRT